MFKYLALAMGTLPFLSFRASAADMDSVEGDINTLIDPHAGSNQKIMATRHMSEHAPDPKSPQGQRAIEALARQTHYDMDSVRKVAFDVLVDMIGLDKAVNLKLAPAAVIDTFVDTFVEDFNAAMKGWEGAENLGKNPVTSRPEARRRAVRLLATMAKQVPMQMKLLDGSLKKRLVHDLELIDRDQPSVRFESFSALRTLGPMSADAIPVVLRALADDDAKVRAAVSDFLPLNWEELDDQARTAVASGLVDPNEEIARAARSLVGHKMPESFERCIVQAVLGAVTASEVDAVRVLKEYHVDLKHFANAAYLRLVSGSDRDRQFLLQALHQADANAQLDDSRELRELVAGLLTRGDDELRVAAARVLTTKESRVAAADALLFAVKHGQRLSPAMLKALKPDAEKFGQLLVEPMLKGELETQQAAVDALTITGAEGAAVRAILTEILRHPDPELRHAAARALNTPEAFARAGVPELLQDIRNDSITVRQVAARQFDGLHLEPKEFTTAVIRAVDQRDMPAREGLIAAMTWANLRGQNPIDVLKESAAKEQNVTRRVYARAALREVEAGAKSAKENMP